MKEFKGTPSPWEKVITKGNSIVVRGGKKYPSRDLYEVNVTLGQIYDDDCGNKDCCCVKEHANAQLISAAPDLLEALHNTLNALKAFIHDKGLASEWVEVIQAEKALNKALGL